MPQELPSGAQLIPGMPPKQKYTDQELCVLLAGQIAGLKIHLPEHIKKATASGKYTIQQIANMRAAGVKEVDMLEAILAHFVMPPMKQSGCNWKVDKRGGFEVHAYISAQDMAAIKLPNDDADLFHDLIKRNKAVGVLSALSIVFGHWEKERQKEQKEIAQAAEESMGHA